MITGKPNSPVFFMLPESDLQPLDSYFKIKIAKPDSYFSVDGLIPTVTFLSNDNIGFGFCNVALVDQDLPNGEVYLAEGGEYKLIIYTGPTSTVGATSWSEIYTDLYRHVLPAVNYTYYT